MAGAGAGRTCFVCDGGVVGGNRYSTLASCKTQASKQRLVDKLGQLVGEQYMVVISEEDVICRSCSTMLNSLDRLERELSSVRAVLLRFLERKYELDEGELMTDQVTLPPPPEPPAAIAHALMKAEIQQPLSFQERKKQSEQAVAESKSADGGDLRSNVWMQCDKCRYTTPYTSFMIHHIHKHAEPQPTPPPPSPPPPSAAGQPPIQVQEQKEEEGKGEGEGEEVPMTNGVVRTKVERQEEGSGMAIDYDQQAAVEGVQGEGEEESDVVEMDLTDENLCMVDENGVVQKVRQGEDGQFYLVSEEGEGEGEGVALQVMWDGEEEEQGGGGHEQ